MASCHKHTCLGDLTGHRPTWKASGYGQVAWFLGQSLPTWATTLHQLVAADQSGAADQPDDPGDLNACAFRDRPMGERILYEAPATACKCWIWARRGTE